MSSYFPRLRELCLQVKAFPSNFSLGSYLPTTLQLPHLQALEITSPGSYLLDRLTAKALKSLTLYSPHDCHGTQISSSIKAAVIHGQLLHLKFADWKPPNTSSESLRAVAVFRALSEKTPQLLTLNFSRSFVDGGTLVSTIGKITDESTDTSKRRELEELTLSYPAGITNDQCEELKKLVKK
ncbi:12747_t:CDS:2, partial [Acaulospora colombiana]